MRKEKWASTFYSNYGSFETWWNKNFKRTLMSEFAYTMPDQKELFPYKFKVPVVAGYVWGFGSLLLLTGEKWAAMLLLIPHVLHTIILHGPLQAKTMTAFQRADQAMLLDFAIVAALLMITGSQLSISSDKKKQVDQARAF